MKNGNGKNKPAEKKRERPPEWSKEARREKYNRRTRGRRGRRTRNG